MHTQLRNHCIIGSFYAFNCRIKIQFPVGLTYLVPWGLKLFLEDWRPIRNYTLLFHNLVVFGKPYINHNMLDSLKSLINYMGIQKKAFTVGNIFLGLPASLPQKERTGRSFSKVTTKEVTDFWISQLSIHRKSLSFLFPSLSVIIKKHTPFPSKWEFCSHNRFGGIGSEFI